MQLNFQQGGGAVLPYSHLCITLSSKLFVWDTTTVLLMHKCSHTVFRLRNFSRMPCAGILHACRFKIYNYTDVFQQIKMSKMAHNGQLNIQHLEVGVHDIIIVVFQCCYCRGTPYTLHLLSWSLLEQR